MKKILLLIVSINYSLFSQEYKIPPEVIKNLVEADPQPTLNLNNKGTLGLIIKRDGYQSISDLAKDELRIAGTRLDPVRYTSSRMTYYKSFSLIDIKSANEIDVNYFFESLNKILNDGVSYKSIEVMLNFAKSKI